MSAPASDSPRGRFESLADDGCAALLPGEDLVLYLQGEDTDFVRFNQGRVRQPGSVRQEELSIRLIRGGRHATVDRSLSADAAGDRAAVLHALSTLRERLPELPEDPHLSWDQGSAGVVSEEHVDLDGGDLTRTVVSAAADADLVGIQTNGPVWSGLATSRGQRSWHQRSSWLVDFCLYHQGDKAVKRTVAGTDWQPDAVEQAVAGARARLPLLARPLVSVPPGRHRAWLSPAAMAELMELLSYSAFGLRAARSRNTPLLSLLDGERALDPRLRLSESVEGALAPDFSPDGFRRPATVPLVEGGRVVGHLVSPRSATEYGVAGNGAASGEAADSLVMGAGNLPTPDVLEALGTGLYVSDLWYLNYSDMPAGRITGMTRFATLWVEDGEIVGPAEVMRFDETLAHLLGSGMERLGQEVAFLPGTGSYDRRSTSSMRLPGMLVDGMRFTL